VLQAEVLTPGEHFWQGLAGVIASLGYETLAMTQPLPQEPAWHTWPLPQLVPSVTGEKLEVLTEGWQLWHTLPGFWALGA
jgi:hypothetical protein